VFPHEQREQRAVSDDVVCLSGFRRVNNTRESGEASDAGLLSQTNIDRRLIIIIFMPLMNIVSMFWSIN
jgi:hypothetical protein